MPTRRTASYCALLPVLALMTLVCSGPVRAQAPELGVNVINPYALSKDAQDDVLAAIHTAGVTVIRASLTLDDKGVEFAERAQRHGIRIEWLIYRFGHYDPFGTVPLSAADPDGFRSAFQAVLDKLEAKGIVLAGFELGNEINLSATNPEFVAHPGRARQLSLTDLASDPQGQRVARGYVRYLEVLSVLKTIRDHSRLNQRTPIMTAGLGSYDQEDGRLPGWVNGDVVSISTTLRYMRLHGLDSLVDAYAVHIYPDTKLQGPDAAAIRRDRMARFDLAECARPKSGVGKPCWITEWGVDNHDPHCPVDDRARADIVSEIMQDFRSYTRDGRVAGLLYFAWNSTPTAPTILSSGIWRCNGLSPAGKLAIDGELFR